MLVSKRVILVGDDVWVEFLGKLFGGLGNLGGLEKEEYFK